MYPHNPNISFKPTLNEHYVAFDSSAVNDNNEYIIHFEQVYRNVVSVSLESAFLPCIQNQCIALHIKDMDNLESGGVFEDGKVKPVSWIDNAFSLFHFENDDTSGYKHFSDSDIIPRKRELQTPIGKLAQLHLSWVNTGTEFNDKNHTLIFKITTSS